MDRMGNSLDRSLLLARLLLENGHQIRLVRANLPDQLAQEKAATFSELRFANKQMLLDSYRDLEAVTSKLSKDDISSDLPMRRFEEGDSARHFSRLEALTKEVEKQSEFISKNLKIEGSSATVPLDVFRDHWWIQVNSDGAWVDLDVSDLINDGSIQNLDQIYELSDAQSPIQSLPGDLLHRVVVRLVIEKRDGQTVQEQVPLEHVIVPAENPGLAMQLSIVPRRDRLIEALRFVGDDPSILSQSFSGLDEWQPFLQLGTEQINGVRFDDKGNLLTDEVAENEGGGLLGTALSQITDELEQRAPGILSGAWIEYEIYTPGEASKTSRRQLFDLVGVENRAADQSPAQDIVITEDLARWRASALTDMVQILPQVAWMTPGKIRQMRLKSILDNAPFFSRLVGAASTGASLDSDAFAPALIGGPHMLALARLELSPIADSIYIDRINLLTNHTMLSFDKAGKLKISRSADIVENRANTLHGTDRVSAGITQGVTDTLAEAITSGGVPDMNNAALLVMLGERYAIRWQTFEPSVEVTVKQLPRQVAARISEATQTGYHVLAPDRLVRLAGAKGHGWWRIDPVHGTTLGLNHNGWGNTTTEYAIITSAIVYCTVAVASAEFSGIGKESGSFFNGLLSECHSEYTDSDSEAEPIGDVEGPNEIDEENSSAGSSTESEGAVFADPNETEENEERSYSWLDQAIDWWNEPSDPDWWNEPEGTDVKTEANSSGSEDSPVTVADAGNETETSDERRLSLDEALNNTLDTDSIEVNEIDDVGVDDGSLEGFSEASDGPARVLRGNPLPGAATEASTEEEAPAKPRLSAQDRLKQIDSIGGIDKDGNAVSEEDRPKAAEATKQDPSENSLRTGGLRLQFGYNW